MTRYPSTALVLLLLALLLSPPPSTSRADSITIPKPEGLAADGAACGNSACDTVLPLYYAPEEMFAHQPYVLRKCTTFANYTVNADVAYYCSWWPHQWH